MDNTRDYARVSHSRQWSNNNIVFTRLYAAYLIKLNYTERCAGYYRYMVNTNIGQLINFHQIISTNPFNFSLAPEVTMSCNNLQ